MSKVRGYFSYKNKLMRYISNEKISVYHFDAFSNIPNKGNPAGVVVGQNTPQFKPFQGNLEKLADALGIAVADIDLSIPIMYGNTGTWTLLVPIAKLSTFCE